MSDDFQDCSYLWDGREIGWVLLSAPDLAGGYSIFNSLKNTLQHIVDSALNAALCMKMKESGCEIIDEISGEGLGVKPVRPD